MRLLVALVLVVATLAYVPVGAAHQCASGSTRGDCVCPVPDDGQYHQHAYPGGSCQGGPGGQQSATPGGASQSIPAPAIGALFAALVGAAMLPRRR